MKLKCVFIKYHRIERYVHLKKRMILLKRIGIPSMHFHMLLFVHGSSESRCTQTSSWRNNKFLFHNKFYKIFISVFVKMILLLCILYIFEYEVWSLSWFESYHLSLYHTSQSTFHTLFKILFSSDFVDWHKEVSCLIAWWERFAILIYSQFRKKRILKMTGKNTAPIETHMFSKVNCLIAIFYWIERQNQ